MDISLDGAETTVIKAIGVGGGEIDGETLIERAVGLEIAEIIDAVTGLILVGYVVSDFSTFSNSDDVKKAHFHVNSGYAKQLKEACDPKPQDRKPKRIRRE